MNTKPESEPEVKIEDVSPSTAAQRVKLSIDNYRMFKEKRKKELQKDWEIENQHLSEIYGYANVILSYERAKPKPKTTDPKDFGVAQWVIRLDKVEEFAAIEEKDRIKEAEKFLKIRPEKSIPGITTQMRCCKKWKDSNKIVDMN